MGLDVWQVIVEPAQVVVVLLIVQSWKDAAARQLWQILPSERKEQRSFRKKLRNDARLTLKSPDIKKRDEYQCFQRLLILPLTPGGRCLRGKRVLLVPERSCSRDVLSLFSRRLSKYGCWRSCSQVSRSEGSILRQP